MGKRDSHGPVVRSKSRWSKALVIASKSSQQSGWNLLLSLWCWPSIMVNDSQVRGEVGLKKGKKSQVVYVQVRFLTRWHLTSFGGCQLTTGNKPLLVNVKNRRRARWARLRKDVAQRCSAVSLLICHPVDLARMIPPHRFEFGSDNDT